MVLLLMDQRRDLSNYLHERAIQGILSIYSIAEVHAEMMQMLKFYSEVQQ